MQTQFLDGIWLMAVGMGTVFGFLLMLVAAMQGAARIIQDSGPEAVLSAPAEEDEAPIAAAIAIARAYSRN